MPRNITMAVDLPASPARLYRMYLDPKQHAAFTGAPVKIAAKAGAKFEAFGGALSGTVLQVVPNRLMCLLVTSREAASGEFTSRPAHSRPCSMARVLAC
jgi:uncharacterized protein YndB with AHSA1/START domain